MTLLAPKSGTGPGSAAAIKIHGGTSTKPIQEAPLHTVQPRKHPPGLVLPRKKILTFPKILSHPVLPSAAFKIKAVSLHSLNYLS